MSLQTEERNGLGSQTSCRQPGQAHYTSSVEGLPDKSLRELIEKVVHGFVAGLQNDSVDTWQSFNEILAIIQPYSSFIEGNSQLMHYVERTYSHLCENPNCGLDFNALRLAFPLEIIKLQQADKVADNKKVKFPSGSPETEIGDDHAPLTFAQRNEKKEISVPKGEVIRSSSIYDDNIESFKSVLPDSKLYIEDLRKSLPFVVYEIGLREASWGKPLGIATTALNIDLEEIVPASTSPRESRSYATGGSSSTSFNSVQAGHRRAKEEKSTDKEDQERRPLTGREVVEKFVKGSFLGSSKFAYLNQVRSQHFDPYNLVAVPRSKTEPEHYVVSSHAILHVIPKGPSELQPLADWYKEALLFSAILKFRFFKHFLVRKMFLRWKRVKKISQFKALRDQVGQTMITCTPSFTAALLRISCLIQDLDQVQFLPIDDLNCKSLQEFNDVTEKLLHDAQELMDMFFTYCLLVINKTKENCYDYLEYCKEQLQRKSQNPKGSLSLAKEKKAIKQQNMKHAYHEIYQLKRFVKLVEQILLAKLLALARNTVCTFVNEVLDSEEIKDRGLFSVLLQFDKADKLVLVPSSNVLQGSLFFAVESVLNILCKPSGTSEEEVYDNRMDKLETGYSPVSSNRERSDSKPGDTTSPSMLHGLRSAHSPTLSVPSTSLPTLSVCDRHEEADARADEINGDLSDEVKNDTKAEHLRRLLAESLRETEELPQKGETEDRPESVKACISPPGGLLVEGKEVQVESAFISPLSKKKIEATVLQDAEVLSAIAKQKEIVKSALEDVNEFCHEHEWMVEINSFVRTWNAAKLASWRGKSPRKIEKQLSQIKTWIEEITNHSKSFCTKNGLLMVDCSGIQDNLVPKLNGIFTQLTKMVAKDLLRMSKDFSSEVTQLAQKLSKKSLHLKRFAEFIMVQKTTKEKVPALQLKVEYIKSLFEMIRSGHRQLTRSEEAAEETTWASWETFLLSLQEASDFLVVETPQVLRDLQETIMSLEHQARVTGEKALKGEFLIPENDPTMILSQLRKLRQKFWSLLTLLNELIKCREVISGKTYDKSHLLEILNQIDVRYQLWKYYDVSAHTIKDWLQMPFRKMNIKKVTEKITEWQHAAENLRGKVSDGDEVYESWVKQMEAFMKDFPLLQQLSNDALKPRHWKALFVGMGQQYDSNWQFTIADLFSFKLGAYTELISSVCSDALKEYALELQLRALAKMWTDKDFKLTKHFVRTRSLLDGETDSLSGRSSARHGAKSRLSDVYILTGDDELMCLIEDNRVTLQLMLVSPYVADLKPTVELWMKSLEQLEEILELWVACQKKWMYLSLVFSEDSEAYGKTVVNQFEQVDTRFKEFMHSVTKDSKVLSVLSKKRGEKGYRELQGEALRSMLFSLLKTQEELLKSIEHNMEKIRETFPRLYFLSDNEVLDIIVTSGDPRKLLPVVRKCFPGIKSVKFGMPGESTAKLSTALDAALNAHLLQVTAIEGDFRETLVLNEPISAGMDSEIWLTVLEKSMRISLKMNFTKCIVNYLSQRKYQRTAVSDILNKDECENGSLGDEETAQNEESETPWLLKYPSQCVRSVEAVAWSSDVTHALSSEDKNELKSLSCFATRRIDDYSKVLNGKEYSWFTSIPRGRPSLKALLVYAVYQRDVIERLLACNATCPHCFEWQSCLQHHVTLKQMFSTTYCTGLPGTSRGRSKPGSIPLDMKYETEQYKLCLLGSEFPYGFEFLSEHVTLVLTPLTERCFLTLTMALNQYSCGSPFGCRGSGKTETIKELAKMMGRHLVFFNCSHSMVSSVAARLLTGMVLSGNWVCFEDAQNLSQGMLSTLGKDLGCIREAYKCLVLNERNQYGIRGTAKSDTRSQTVKESRAKRRNSLVSLNSLAVPETVFKRPSDVAAPNQTKKSATISRRFSVAEGRNIDKTRYYEDKEPLPISIPLTPNSSLTDCELFSSGKKDKLVDNHSEQTLDLFLGNIVFNGMLLRAHRMAGCFVTVTPSTDGYLEVPENLKVCLRPVAMMLPDMMRIIEVWLLCNGFSDVRALAEKIIFFVKVLRDELPAEYHIRTNALKTAVNVAGNKLRQERVSSSGPTEAACDTDKTTEQDQPSKEEIEGVASAASFLEAYENRTKEESAVVYGLFSVLCSKLDEKTKELVCEITDTIFTHTVLTSSAHIETERVAEAVREQLSAESLQPNLDLVAKVVQLYQLLQTNHTVIIMGSSGTGKTTVYQTLCKAINSLNTQVARDSTVAEATTRSAAAPAAEPKYPKINLSVLFPRAMNENELFGYVDPVTKLWVDGILVKRARNAEAVKNAAESLFSRSKREKAGFTSDTAGGSASRSDFHQWIVLDGALDLGCIDQVNALFDDSRTLSLANGETVPLSETMRVLFELDDLQSAAPSVVSRCGIVYCPENTVGWKNILKSWLKGAHGTWNISMRGLVVLSSLADHCVEKTLAFLDNQCSSILYTNYYDYQTKKMAARGVPEIQRLVGILSSLFDKYILRDNDETFDILDNLKDRRYSSRASSETISGRSSGLLVSDTATVISSFAYAFIWAFGGHLHESCLETFDEFAKDLLSSGPHPRDSLPPVTVFDYHLDFPTGSLLSSTERLSGRTRTIASSYVVTPRAEVYFSLLDHLVASNKPVLLVGPPGSGKTSFMQNLINPRYKFTRISLAHGMTTRLLQETIEAKVQSRKRRRSVVKNPVLLAQTSRNTFFLDDFNLAATDGTSNQPASELLRSLLSLGGLYDRQRHCLMPLSDICIVGAAIPPGSPGTGGGVSSFPISPRLARIMIVLSFPPVSGATLRSIYRDLVHTWLEDFPAYSLTHHRQLAKAISSATVTMFETIAQDLRPTPVHPDYVFTHHDVARVFQGMMLFSSRTKSRPRPKARQRRRMAEQNTREMAVLNEQNFSNTDISNVDTQGQNNIHHNKSWPVMAQKETLVSKSKTPGVLAPMIRTILRLWCHECTRVFSDRLMGEDKLWFSTALRKTALQQFCETSLCRDEQDNTVVGNNNIPAEGNKNVLTSSIEESAVGDEDIKVMENKLREEDNANCDDLAKDVDQTSKGDEVNVLTENEKEDEVVDGNSCVDAPSHHEAITSSRQKPEDEFRLSDDNLVEELKPSSQETSVPRTAPSKQRVVTFEDMSREYIYRGPLISSEQLTEPGEDLSKIIFCRHFGSTSKTSGHEHDKSYNECSVALLAEGLKRCQQMYNSQDNQPLDLVFFEQAVRHAARLSRCLCLTSGHTILLSKSGHGRKSLVLLASFAANYKLIKLQRSHHEDSRQRMKSAIYSAGLQSKPVVLYVPEDIDQETLQAVCSLMSEGNVPGLYSAYELTTICSELIPGGQKGRRNENMTVAQERFFRRVRTNLHVVLCLDHPTVKSDDLRSSAFSLFPFLTTRPCGIDVYQPWHRNALTRMSLLRLTDVVMDSTVQEIVRTHRNSVASAMSYIHTSSIDVIARQFGFNRYKCYTPATFVELIDTFAKCCDRIWIKEQEKIEMCKKALAKVDEAKDQINEMHKDLDSFVPVLKQAEQEVKDCLHLVESLQEEYAEGRAKCKEQEGEIEKMMSPIAELERLAKIELDRVSPVFRSAYDALQALNVYDVEEIRSYRTPPDQVVLVVNAVCLLFGREESWEEGKVLFSREDFIKDLEFFDMKAISDKTFRRLKDYVDNPKFVPESVKEGSLAAMSICVWIRAVYHFCVVYREYFPKQQRVVEAKKILDEAVAFLGDLRVHCNEIKADVERKIEEYKEKVHHARSIEKQIQLTEQKKSRAISLIQSMSMHVKSWKKSLACSEHHVKTLIGDALLTSACLCYLGPMDDETRHKLLSDWKVACKGTMRKDTSVAEDDDDNETDDETDCDSASDSDLQRSFGRKTFTNVRLPVSVSRIPVRSDFSLKGIFTSEEELYNWRYSGLPTNSAAMENALMMRSIGELASKHWPLLIDTDLQSYMWIECLHQQATPLADPDDIDLVKSNVAVENQLNEDVSLSLPASPYLTSTDHDSDLDDRSTNFEESDSTTPRNSDPGSRRTSRGGSGQLVREDLARELNILTSPLDYTSAESTSTDAEFGNQHIMIISATDKRRDMKLCNAVSCGSTVILVDVERRKIGARLDHLLSRNTFTDKTGKKKIRIGSRSVDYHPSFRLYLYTNIPLELGTREMSLPFKKCLVINMALSCDGLQEHLLSHVLALEHPEYETQRRALVADVYHHEETIKLAENAVFERVIGLSERLLENSTIPEALRECDETCDVARQQLEESRALYELAREKQEDYAHVSEHGAALVIIVSKMAKLNLYYQMPLHASLRLFHEVISQRRRGKRLSGCSLARSAELITYITRSMCSRVARSVFSDHYDVFTFLVAAEKLRLAGQIPEDEWELFCRPTPHMSTGTHTSDFIVNESIPSWISPKVWEDVLRLDSLSGFQGLKESIRSNMGLWKEYFELPPILMAPTPSNFHQLSLFQRALLWKTFKREKLYDVCRDLVLSQLGTNATTVTSFSIDDAYQDSSCITPLIFLVPQTHYKQDWRKQNLKDPVEEIIALARRLKMDDKLRFVTCDEEVQTNASSVLRVACERGLWVVLQNCHLVQEWSPELIEIIHQITLAGSKQQIMSKHGLFEPDTIPYTVTSCEHAQSLAVHPRFRLWLITTPGCGTLLPAAVVRCGLKVAWDDKLNFENVVRQSFLTIWNKHTRSDKVFKELNINDVQADPLLPYLHSLALFHSILHCRSQYRSHAFNIPYNWRSSDLSWGLEAICLLKSSVLCSCSNNTDQNSSLRQTISILYGGQVMNLLDWRSIVALSENHFISQTLGVQTADEIGEPSTDMLFGRVPLTLAMKDMGLNEHSSSEHGNRVSNQLATNISTEFGALQELTSVLKPVSYFKEILDTLLDMRSMTWQSPRNDRQEKDESSLEVCFRSEKLGYQALLDAIVSQLNAVVQSLQGDVSFTPDLRELAVTLSVERIPETWRQNSNTSQSLTDWICCLRNRVRAINKYCEQPSTLPLTVDIGAVLKKQSLFYAMILHWSKATGTPVHRMDIKSEVLSSSVMVPLSAEDGVYLTGLVLCNASWNESEGCIEELREGHRHTAMPCILLRPSERNEPCPVRREMKDGIFQHYDCPVNFNDDLTCRSGPTSFLPYVTLRSRVPCHVCQQQRVFLTCPGF